MSIFHPFATMTSMVQERMQDMQRRWSERGNLMILRNELGKTEPLNGACRSTPVALPTAPMTVPRFVASHTVHGRGKRSANKTMPRLSERAGLEYSFNHARQREIHAAGGLERQRPQRTVSEARESMGAAMRKLASESDK